MYHCALAATVATTVSNADMIILCRFFFIGLYVFYVSMRLSLLVFVVAVGFPFAAVGFLILIL